MGLVRGAERVIVLMKCVAKDGTYKIVREWSTWITRTGRRTWWRSAATESAALAQAVRWHCEGRVVLHGNRTVVLR